MRRHVLTAAKARPAVRVFEGKAQAAERQDTNETPIFPGRAPISLGPKPQGFQADGRIPNRCCKSTSFFLTLQACVIQFTGR
jgi:hypothetical protein